MKKLRPFRFGVTGNGATTREAWLALARKVEAQGYATLLMNNFACIAAVTDQRRQVAQQGLQRFGGENARGNLCRD